MILLTYELAQKLKNTNNERTASGDEGSLMLGVGETVYMEKSHAEKLLDQPEFDSVIQSPNTLFVHIPDSVLFHLLRREDFYLSEDEN